jgi:hypothetical protein
VLTRRRSTRVLPMVRSTVAGNLSGLTETEKVRSQQPRRPVERGSNADCPFGPLPLPPGTRRMASKAPEMFVRTYLEASRKGRGMAPGISGGREA